MSNEQDLDNLLDESLEKLRSQRLPDEKVATTIGQVWEKLEAAGASSTVRLPAMEPTSRIRDCSDLQALIPDYLAGTLNESRRLLLEDHLNQCVPCRRALRVAREGRKPAPVVRARSQGLPWMWIGGISSAAALLLVAALAWSGAFDEFLPGPEGARATVESLEGTLFRVSSEGSLPVTEGTELWEGDRIRTARLSGAVIRLQDGSRVEMDERSELAVRASRAGQQVELARGQVLVEAAPQEEGYLAVQTQDCTVTVKGTVFTVNHGTRGSRVSVLEGHVSVARLGKTATLMPGQQYASRETLGRVSLAREVAWSRHAPEHLKVVQQLDALGRELDEAFRSPLRNSLRLTHLAPENTAIYIALPNLSQSLGEAERIFQERLEQNMELQQWWNQRGAEFEPQLREVLERLRNLGAQLGEEIVVAIGLEEGNPGEPLILAEAGSGAPAAVAREVERINREVGKTVLRLIDDPFAEQASDGVLFVMVHQGIFAASPSLARLQEVGDLLASGALSTFAGTRFADRIGEAYQEGVAYLLAVDVKSLIAAQVEREDEPGATDEQAFFNRLGLLDVRDILVERRPAGELYETRATVGFDKARQGLASWLAEPASMGSFDFISADATVAAAFVVKDPELMVEDLFQLIQAGDPDAWEELVQFQLETGINLQQDLAAPLGGEIAFALDGPVLPQPSWKMILEVYDPARLQQTIEWALQEVNDQMAQQGESPLELVAQTSGGRTFYSVVSSRGGSEVHYTYVDGYLVAAPSRALLLNAMRFRQTGYTLQRSSKFLERLPADRRTNFSAVMYQDLGSLLAPLAERFGGSPEELSEETRHQLEQLAGQLQSSLYYAYADSQQITLAGTGDRFAPFGMSGGLGGFLGVAELLEMSR